MAGALVCHSKPVQERILCGAGFIAGRMASPDALLPPNRVALGLDGRMDGLLCLKERHSIVHPGEAKQFLYSDAKHTRSHPASNPNATRFGGRRASGDAIRPAMKPAPQRIRSCTGLSGNQRAAIGRKAWMDVRVGVRGEHAKLALGKPEIGQLHLKVARFGHHGQIIPRPSGNHTGFVVDAIARDCQSLFLSGRNVHGKEAAERVVCG